ncbi:MAG: PKD domain-containing protein, partial [Salinivirgaceae bacterium]|nr:PKD domain-containing protein [Salinivirgaceae bacterium]
IGQSVMSSSAPDGNFLNGQIAEVIAFNTVDSLLRKQVYNYLYNKYALASVSLGLDIQVPYGFADTVITTAYNPGFVSYLWSTSETDSVIHVNKPGSYWVTVTNAFGYSSSDTINVFYPEPAQLRDTTICAGDTIVWNTELDGTYSYLWSDGSTESSIEITTEGEYWLTITDTAGYSWKSDTITVKVDSFPVTAGLASDNIAACVGNNIYLQTGYDEAVSYLWSDGSTNDHFVVTEPGVYWVKIADRLGCTTTDTARIEVLGIAPTPDFSHTALCATRDIEFENQSHTNDTSLINGYLWQFGDGSSSSVAHPVHAYSAGGKYNVQLTVSTTNGCSNVLKQTLIVDSLPKAAFTPAQACSGTPVQFTDISSTPVNYITEWQWTINDSVFTERNPRTMYNTAGDKPVQLVVATAHGCIDTLRSTISILQGPVVDFDYSAPCLNTPLYCTNKTVSALNLAISYVWQIDGEERSTMKSPNFNLSDTGSYQIMLTAKQLSNGCSASKSKTISIRPLPKPIISVGLLCQNLPSQVKAENAETESVVGSWLWTIDDAKNANGQTSMLTFESEGKHHLTITATDIVGCENKADTVVVVRPTPEAAFSITPERGPVPFAPSFINRSTDADSYQWVLDNTFASADEELHHTFADSGSHIVRLIATNQYGCADTTQRTAIVFVPSTDLLIMQAEVEPVGNYMRISAVVANNSPYDLVNSTISFTDNLGHSIRETITDTIKSGKILMYTFAAEIELAVNRLNYICVNVEPAIGDDETPADNQFCIAMNSDEFSVEPVKPNPADNYLRISYIAPQEGRTKIELFNQVGTPVATLFDGTATAGYNEIVIDASGLKSGMYHYRITYGGRSRVGVVMIMH